MRGIRRLHLGALTAGVVALMCAAFSPAALAAGARRLGAAPGAARLQLVLPLVADTAGLSRLVTAITTPGSPQYDHYESIPELSSRFGATAARRAKVVAFLRAAGATGVRIDATGLFADATMTAAQAQRLFSVGLVEFRNDRGARFTAPAAAPRLPAGLRGLATGVVGLDTRTVAAARAFHRSSAGSPPGARTAAANVANADAGAGSAYTPASGTPAGCGAGLAAQGFTPNQYLTAYGFDPLQSASLLGQGERVALIEIDGFRSRDISTFASCFGLAVPTINGFGVGVNHPLPPGGEATLDLEILDAAAPHLKSIDVYETTASPADVLRALTAPLQNPGFKPEVVSASLGLCERDTRQAVGNAGLRATESALQMAAASGISFLAATGDDGSADCVSGSTTSSPPDPVLAVNYPASSPWVTAVGGTNFTLNPGNSIVSQTVWNDGSLFPGAAGGGGFSALFSRPAYQNGTVAVGHRALPDVALLADIAPGYDVYCTATPDCIASPSDNPWQTVGGTSAATPLFAGGLVLIDEQLRTHQRQDLGLVNPLLYGIGRNPQLAPSVFQDVTTGSNDVGPVIPGYARPLGCCSAAPGFDEASGWGGVNVANLAAVALSAQPAIVNISLTLPRRQQPVRRHHLLAKVTCSGPCLFGAFARVTIARQKPFTVYSSLYHLTKQGSRTIPIGFSKADLTKLRTALRRHRRVTASIIGAIVDAAGNIERRTSARSLRITG